MSRRAPTAGSDLRFDIRELGRRTAAMNTVQRTAVAPEGMGVEMIGVPPGSPIDLELRFESVVEGVLVTGTAEVDLHGVCARCLRPIEFTELVDLMELFLYPGKEPDDEEASRVEGDEIDLEPVLRDAVVLDLPFTPVCADDCAGLCPECGQDLNLEPDHTHGEAVDPRWAELSALKSET